VVDSCAAGSHGCAAFPDSLLTRLAPLALLMNFPDIRESGVDKIEGGDNRDEGEDEEEDPWFYANSVGIPRYSILGGVVRSFAHSVGHRTVPVRWFESEEDAMYGIFKFESIESVHSSYCYLDLEKFSQKFGKPPCRVSGSIIPFSNVEDSLENLARLLITLVSLPPQPASAFTLQS